MKKIRIILVTALALIMLPAAAKYAFALHYLGGAGDGFSSSDTHNLAVTKDANKKEVTIGEIVTYTVTVRDNTGRGLSNVYLVDIIPAGFKYLEGKVRLDGEKLSDPEGDRPLEFDIGTIGAGAKRILKYQLVVGSGVTFGKYKNSAFMIRANGKVISNTASETVKVVPDPLFDLGTVIGKVFWDWDGDGAQREPGKQHPAQKKKESGIANVKIAMEDGTVITTDKDGKYHVPGVVPGRHAFLVDESTLPEGARLTTSRVIIDDVRPGLMSKINFGVTPPPEESHARKKEPGGKEEDERFFLIAMGDGEIGYNFGSGNTEPLGKEDRFRQCFWADGRLAYYLKGKIQGKYLITSSLDTRRKRKALFKYIDPDKFYPVYGDNSVLSYEATDTQGMLYALVEWDKNRLIWGNYNVDLLDTEFARFSRTLYGGKVMLISASETEYGEPDTKIIVFAAKARQKAAHNEFTGTGTSLFYLKHKHIIEGSDKVRIEVRDKITGLVIKSLGQKEGSDYRIDYDNGRIMFWKPVRQITESQSIISNSLLDGNMLYVVADYEYEAEGEYNEWSKGARISKQLHEHVRIGGTYVEDNSKAKKDYILKGVDATIKVAENVRLDAEYSETRSEEGSNFISTDGGITFDELPTDESAEGRAYGASAKARLFNRLNISGYYKRVENEFSSPFIMAHQGTEKTGGEMSFDILPGTVVSARYDVQKLIKDGNLESMAQIGAKETVATTVGLKSELTKQLDLTGEYRHQSVSKKRDDYETETNRSGDIVAGRIGYKPTDKIRLFSEYQKTLTGERDNQFTAGGEVDIAKYLTLRATEVIGTKGNATTVGAVSNVNDRFDLFCDYAIADKIKSGLERTVSAGGKAKVDDETSFYNTYSVSDSGRGKDSESAVFGATKKLDNDYEVSVERHSSRRAGEHTMTNAYKVAKDIEGRKIEGELKQETTDNKGSVSDTNIFGLSGDINDNCALNFEFQKGIVQNLNGTKTKRIAVSSGINYRDEDITEASSKLEFRFDDGDRDTRQILSYNTFKKKVTEDTTLFGKANISYTVNRSASSTLADFKEIVTGLAYRPVYCDKLNLIGKYSFLEEGSPDYQADFQDVDRMRTHVLGLEAVYDLNAKFQIVEKAAVRRLEEKISDFDLTNTHAWLLANRLNYNLDKNWRVSGEYRVLHVIEAMDLKQGAVFEVSRKIGESVRISAGYNFTGFSDSLSDLDHTVHGPFIQITGVLYEGSEEEIERARKKKELKKQQENLAACPVTPM